MAKRAGRTIHPFRTSGVNAPGYSRPAQQQSAGTPAPPTPVTARQRPAAAPGAPQRPQDARTASEALVGLQRAAAPKLVTPRFTDTTGPWIRLGDDQVRVPRDVIVSTTRARDGRHIAVVAHLDSSDSPGRMQVLVDSTEGVRELVGLAPQHLAELRRAHFGK